MITYATAKLIIDNNLKTIANDFAAAFQELEKGQALIIKNTEKIVFFCKEMDGLYIYLLSEELERDVKIQGTYAQLHNFFENKEEVPTIAFYVQEFSELLGTKIYDDEIAPHLKYELIGTPFSEEAIDRMGINIKLQSEQAKVPVTSFQEMKIFYDTSKQETQISIGQLELVYDLDGNNLSALVWEEARV